jgi:two-component sensor histidine kinase
MKFLKTITLLLFVTNSFATIKKNDSLKSITFFNYTNYDIKKVRLFNNIVLSNSSGKSTKEWIHFFNIEETKYENNFSELFHITRCKTILYNHTGNFEKSNKILYSFYYKYKNTANKNKLCQILKTLSNNCIKLNKKSELLLINKEQLEICPTSATFYELYSKIGLVDLAIESYKKKTSYKKKGKSFRHAKDFNNIGALYKKGEKYDSAFYYFNKSLKIFQQIKQKGVLKNKEKLNFWIGLVKGNLGECYLEYKNYYTAIKLFSVEEKEARKWFKGKLWPYEDAYFRDIATCFLNTGQLNLAKKYIDSLFFKKNIFFYTKLKLDYFNATKKYDSTYHYHKLYVKIYDSIAKQNKQNLNNSIKKLIDFQEELVAQKFKIAEIKEDHKFHHRELIIISIILALLVILTIALMYYILKKNNQKVIIEQQNEAIKKSLLEKNILLSELHHRVKNNFQIIISILNLQLRKIKDHQLKNTFQYSINRISTIAQIHDKLHQNKNLHKIILYTYIENIINNLEIVYNSLKAITIDINIDPKISIHIDQTQALGLIINELVTNSNKYAFSKPTDNLIHITIKEKKGIIHFSYTDNGQGFDIDKIITENSIGLTLIQRLANQLGTKVDITAKKGMSTTFSFKKK